MSWASLSSRPYQHLSEHPRTTQTTLVVFECSTEHVNKNGSAAVGMRTFVSQLLFPGFYKLCSLKHAVSMTVLSHRHQGTVFATIAVAAGVCLGSTARCLWFPELLWWRSRTFGKGWSFDGNHDQKFKNFKILKGPLHPLQRSVVFWIFSEVGPFHPVPRSVVFQDSSAKHRSQAWASEGKLNQMPWLYLI